MIAGDIDWGTAGEWASAIAAVSPIGVSLGLYWHERSERRRDEARRDA